MGLGRLVSTLALGAALLGAPTPGQAQSQKSSDNDIEVCQATFDINDAVEDDILRSLHRSQYFFNRNGFDLTPVKGDDCIDVAVQTEFQTINTVVPDTTGYDADRFIPDHDTTMRVMAERYRDSIKAAYSAAEDSIETLPRMEAITHETTLDLIRQSSSAGSASPDSIHLSPYQLWSSSVEASEASPEATPGRHDFVITELSRLISHEILHTYGLPHPWDWKEQGDKTNAPFTNVMAYGMPRLAAYQGESADSVFAYTMSDVQKRILSDALTDTSSYHSLQDTASLRDNYDAFRAYWEDAFPGVDKADYIDAPYYKTRRKWEKGTEQLRDNKQRR